MNSENSLKLIPDDSVRASILGFPINTYPINDSVYDLTPEIYKALSYTGYTGNTMIEESNLLLMNNTIGDLA